MSNILKSMGEVILILITLLFSYVMYNALFNLGIYIGTTIRTMGCI
jgi:hypothetical protein